MPASEFLDQQLLSQVSDRGPGYVDNFGPYTPDMKAADALRQMARDENFYGYLSPNTPVNHDARDSIYLLNRRNAMQDSLIGESFPQISAALPKPDPMPSPFYASFNLPQSTFSAGQTDRSSDNIVDVRGGVTTYGWNEWRHEQSLGFANLNDSVKSYLNKVRSYWSSWW
jgi:hypothetical protein